MRALLCLILLLVAAAAGADTLAHGGLQRSYRLHVPQLPPGRKMPLLLALHGATSTAEQMESSTGFSSLADQEGFLVVYPQGVDKGWNDGRQRGKQAGVDDVGFLLALVDELSQHYPVDPSRIYATGISNGATMCHRLAAERADRIAAIAPVVGGMASELGRDFHPARPVAVLMVQGTADPLVPYQGGKLGFAWGRNRGTILPFDDCLALWRQADHCGPEGPVEAIPDRDPNDGCRCSRRTYPGLRNVSVILIEGGGHGWPGGRQYLGKRMIGSVCQDFQATPVIWEFLKDVRLSEAGAPEGAAGGRRRWSGRGRTRRTWSVR